jgi:hypothetical protein
MVRSLATLMVLLGKPGSHFVVTGVRDRVRFSVDWDCGCVATGTTPDRMELTTCARHLAGRLAAPVLTAC